MQSKNMNTALLAAALVMPSASVFADNNSHSTTAPQAKKNRLRRFILRHAHSIARPASVFYND